MFHSAYNRSLLLIMLLFSVSFSANTSAGFFDDLKEIVKTEEAKLKKETDKLKESVGKLINKKDKNEEKETQSEKAKSAQAEKSKPDQKESKQSKSRTAAAAGGTAVAAQSSASAGSKTNLPSNVEVSEPVHDVYGRFGSAHIEVVNLGGTHYGVVTALGSSTFSLSGKNTTCMHLYHDNMELLGAWQSASTIKSELLNSKLKKYEAYKEKLIKYNNVRVLPGIFGKGQTCIFSSSEIAEMPPKTNFRFKLDQDASTSYLNLDILGQSSGIFYLPRNSRIWYYPEHPEKSTLEFDPIWVSCNSGFSWSSGKHFKKIKERFKSGEFDNIYAAEIELVGVKYTNYKAGLCTVDSIKVRKLN